jgi:hypothetical protein
MKLRALGWVVVLVALGGCAAVSGERAEDIQEKLACGMSPAQVQAAVGAARIVPVRDPRMTHFARLGMADLWMTFDGGGLRSSQVVMAQGSVAAPRGPVNHCR